LKFDQFLRLMDAALAKEDGGPEDLRDADQMNPLVLALLGDSVEAFYVRSRLAASSSHVAVIHRLAAEMVSAVRQAEALSAVTGLLSEEELHQVHRGRNTKSSVPKSASVAQYRAATGLETLFGWLLVKDETKRLEELLEKVYDATRRAMQEDKKA